MAGFVSLTLLERTSNVRIRSLFAAALLGVTLVPSFAVSVAVAQADAKVRVAHFSPDAEAVDIYIDGKKKMNSVPYLAMSEYVSLPAGKHTFEVRGAGTPATGPAILTAEQTVAAGSFSTIAAIGPLATIKAGIFNDKISTPAAGKSKVRVIHAADGTADVDVSLKAGAIAFPKVAFGTATEYAEIDAASYDLQILAAGTQNVVLAKNVTLQGGGVYTIAAIGGADKPPTLRGFVDLTPGIAVPTAAPPAATTTTAAAPPTTKAATATTKAATATTKAAAATTISPATTAGATTTSPATTVAAATATTGPPTTVVAATTTAAPVADTTIAEAVTDTTIAAEAASDTEAASGTEDTVAPTPKGGVGTGFGGLSDSQSSTALVLLGLVVVGAIAAGRSRRRYH